ncbi:MAG: TrmH family RNA methyltransferase [Candidatus Kapaibacteriota bacterium]|jgi:TrmH family RNA methyltransferase
MHYSTPITQRLKKLIRSLHQKQYRDHHSLFIAEGEKLCAELLKSDYITETIVFREMPSSDVIDIVEAFTDKGVPINSAPKHLFDQMCEAKTPQGIIAIVNKKPSKINKKGSFIILDNISDPGNVGTIIRTAEWFGIKQVFLVGDCADHFSPKAVRSSMGSVFRLNIQHVDGITDFLNKNFPNIPIFGGSLEAKKTIDTLSPKGQCGIVFGSESHGISETLNKVITEQFVIKGVGSSDSLNVAVAVGITLFHFNLSSKSTKK